MIHGLEFYLTSWITALALSVTALFLVTRVSFFTHQITRSETGRDATFPIYYRLGGVVVTFLFLLLLINDTRLEWNAPFRALCIGSLVIAVFSFVDDIAHVTWPWHLSFQVLLGLLIFVFGIQLDMQTYFPSISSNWPGIISIVLWVILIMNALNWVDGTDGLMPGIAALSSVTIFILALQPEVNQPTVAILSVILLGLSLGLLFFNWYPARILAGTGGAYFFGFTLATIALYAGMKVATLLIVLAIPIFDALFVFIRRLAGGHSPFLPDRGHLHHLLLAHGWSPALIATVYLLLTALLGLLALALRDGSKALVFISAGLLVAVVIGILHHSLRNVSNKNSYE